jgi:hypothetical protein
MGKPRGFWQGEWRKNPFEEIALMNYLDTFALFFYIDLANV